jgi:hypothetical protein
MSSDAYNEILKQIQRLTPDEQRQLIKDIEAMLHGQAKPKHRHSILELEGLGKEIWERRLHDYELFIESVLPMQFIWLQLSVGMLPSSFFLTKDMGLPSLPGLKILMLDELKTRL